MGAFARWFAFVGQEQRHNRTRIDASALRATSRPASVQRIEIARIVRHLDRPSRDRSRRDFAVVCDLLRLGLNCDEIWMLVAANSKFESIGRSEFDVTVANALLLALLAAVWIRPLLG